jgi:phage terminase large subunit
MATVIFDPFPKQKEFLEAVFSGKHKYLLYGGGVGGGKSFALLGSMLTLLRVYPGSKGIVVRDTYPNLKLSSIESWLKLIHDNVGKKSFITSYNQSEMIFYCANGSQLQFIAEDYAGKKDMNHFRGLEINFAILEEAGDLQEQTFFKCIERCGRHLLPNGMIPPPIVMLSTNPCNNWVRELFYDRAANGTLPPDYYYLPALIADNKYMMQSTGYIESTKANMPEYLYRRFFLGDWNISEPSENQIYRCFKPDQHIGKHPYDPNLPLWASFDENVNPFMSLVLFQIVHEKDKDGKTVKKNAYLIDEILGRHPLNTVEGVCTLFKRKYPFHRSGLFITGDATSRKADTKIESGHNLYTLIEGHLKQYIPKNKVLKSNPSVVMRTNFFNAVFEKEFGNIRFSIDTNCNDAINDFQGTQTDSDGTKLKLMVRDPKTKISAQMFGHITDCADYFMCSAFEAEYKEFLRGGRPEIPISFGKNTGSRNTYDAPQPIRPTIKRQSKNDYI